VLRRHARGGLGEIYVAEDQELHREVALKEIQERHGDNPASRTRFILEAEVTGGLEHPSIVPVYGLGSYADGRPFYAMRFIKGDSLKDTIVRFHRANATGRNLTERTAELRNLLGRFIDVCNAIEYAHSRGVLHRDLKPQNVVLGDYGEVIVLDWGLAKLMNQADDEAAPLNFPEEVEADATMQGQVLGTPAYMAPEQAEGRLDQLGPASDVYGLGAILYEILTGRPPFSGDETAGVLRRVIHEIPARPRSLEKGAPAPLEAVCLKALAKKPRDRYAMAKELASEVQHFLADEPVTAYREPLPVRPASPDRRVSCWSAACRRRGRAGNDDGVGESSTGAGRGEFPTGEYRADSGRGEFRVRTCRRRRHVHGGRGEMACPGIAHGAGAARFFD
jgi:serine/threonine-protein kinase